MYTGIPYDMSYVGAWASGVWQEVNSPSNISPSYISGWLVQDDQLGQLNASIAGSWSGVSGYYMMPGLYPEELALMSAQFKVQWYGREFNRSLSVDSIISNWTSFREGDRGVTRPNASTIGQMFLQAKKDALDEYNRLVVWYKNNVAGANRPSDQRFYSFPLPRPSGPWYDRY